MKPRDQPINLCGFQQNIMGSCFIHQGLPTAGLRSCCPRVSSNKKWSQALRGSKKHSRTQPIQCISQRESLDQPLAATVTLKVPQELDIVNGDCEEQISASDSDVDPLTLFPTEHLPESSLLLALYFPIGEHCLFGIRVDYCKSKSAVCYVAC